MNGTKEGRREGGKEGAQRLTVLVFQTAPADMVEGALALLNMPNFELSKHALAIRSDLRESFQKKKKKKGWL
jgi:hypothetical protein